MSNIRELIKEEYAHCAEDYVYGIVKYQKIEHPIRGKIPFNLYEFQRRTLNEFRKYRFNIVLKARQMGISTLVAGYALMEMIFKENYKVLVIATTQDVAKNLVHKVKVMYANLPGWLRPKMIDNNKLELSFANGSSIKAVSASETAGRSEALSLLIIDEFAFISKIDEIWTSAQSTLATGGDAIILSTPNGVGNLFHRLWTQAEEGIGDENSGQIFNPIKLRWDLHPERDQEWRDGETLRLGEKEAAQEHDCNFITSGHSVIDGPLLKWYETNMVEEPIEKRGEDSLFWIWKYAQAGTQYCVTVDVSRGDATDDSCIQVFDVENMEQVAEWIGKLDPRLLGRLAVVTAIEYNNALLVIENNNIGWMTVQEAIDMNYQNLYYSIKSADLYIDPAKHISKGYDLLTKDEKVPGITTNTKVRPLMISALEYNFRNKYIIVKSQRLINQLYVFSWIGGKAQAQNGFKDDAVMATASNLYVRDTALKLKTMGLERTKLSLDNMHKGVYIPKKKKNPYYEMNDGRGNTLSTKWLL